MDFTNPMILANAMIFHEQYLQMMNNPIFYMPQTNNNTSSYIPSIIPSNLARNIYTSHESQKILPIQDTLSDPILLEDSLTGETVFTGVMGIYEDDNEKSLIVAIAIHHPGIYRMGIIKKMLQERLGEYIENDMKKVYMVVKGIETLDDVELNEFLRGFAGKTIRMNDYYILEKEVES